MVSDDASMTKTTTVDPLSSFTSFWDWFLSSSAKGANLSNDYSVRQDPGETGVFLLQFNRAEISTNELQEKQKVRTGEFRPEMADI